MGAKVAIVMGSQSDWETMTCAAEVLDELGVESDVRIVSAHRTKQHARSAVRVTTRDGCPGGVLGLPTCVCA